MLQRGTQSRATLGGIRQLALLLALFALGGQFIGAAHLLLVPHAVCAEHGELIHVHDGSASDVAVAPHAAPSARAYRGVEAADGADAHDHCLASALRREQLALHQPPSTLILISASRPVAHVEHALPAPKPVTILMLAPKSSPPSFCA